MEATTEAPQTETTTGAIPPIADFIDEQGHLPSYTETDELISILLKALYDEDEPGFWYEDVKLTWVPVRSFMIEDTRTTGRGRQVRINPEIGAGRLWHPRGAFLPAVAFKLVEDKGHSEWSTETLHPRIVAAGPAAVHENVAGWIYHAITGQHEHLDGYLKKLQALREVDELTWMWPQGLDVEPGSTWDADPSDYLPAVGDEEKTTKAGELYGE
jgi:hypothetical protein